jgi:Uma2 family endonuclease
MAAEPKSFISRDTYLALERAGDGKHEYVDGELVAMVGASARHNLIQASAMNHLYPQARQRGCCVFPSDMKVAVTQPPSYSYPDLTLACGTPLYEDEHEDTLLNPLVIIEILSPSTERYDRTTKFRRYQSIPTLQEYLLIAQDYPFVEHFVRQPDGGWLWSAADQLTDVITLATTGCTLALAAIYEQITFPDL